MITTSTTTTATTTTHSIKVKTSNVGESSLVVTDVLQLNFEVPLVFEVFLCQREGVAVVASLAADLDSCLHVKVHLTILGLKHRLIE